MQQELLLNIIPFNPAAGKQTFAFYRQKQEGYNPVFKADLEGLLDDKLPAAELEALEKLYTDFQPAKEGAIELEIDLSVTYRFANHFYRHLIREYFTSIADIMHQNFTSETEVWFHDKDKSNAKFNLYNQFTLKVQHSRVTTGPELVLSYDGTTKVFAKPVSQIHNFNTNLYNWIVCNGVLYKWKYRPQAVINMPEKCYPVLSNEIKPHMEIAHDVPNLSNRYPRYLGILQNFYNKYLNVDAFRSLIAISTDGFFQPTTDQFRVINSTSNDLLYANGKTGKEPKKDFKSKGPYQLPAKQVRRC